MVVIYCYILYICWWWTGLFLVCVCVCLVWISLDRSLGLRFTWKMAVKMERVSCFVCFTQVFSRLFYVRLSVLVQLIDWKNSEVTCDVLMETVNPAHFRPHTHRLMHSCWNDYKIYSVVCLWIVNSNIQSPAGQRRDSLNVLFPWILRVFDLKAIDFLKVLDSFVRAESHLAPEIIKVCLT